MPVTYQLDPVRKIIDTDAHGVVNVAEIVHYLETLLADDRIEYGSTEIFSLENATDLMMNYSDVQVFKAIWARYKEKIGQQVLVIAPTPLSYGIFRMLATSVAASDKSAESAFKILKSREETEAYLQNHE